MVEGGGVTSGCFLIRCHGLGGVDPRKRVAKGHHSIFALRAAGGDHFYICTGELHTVVRPLLLKASVQEALRVGDGNAGLPGHAGFHLQVVEYGLLADVWQGAGGAVQQRRGAGAGLLTRLKISNCIQALATDETENIMYSTFDFTLNQCKYSLYAFG